MNNIESSSRCSGSARAIFPAVVFKQKKQIQNKMKNNKAVQKRTCGAIMSHTATSTVEGDRRTGRWSISGRSCTSVATRRSATWKSSYEKKDLHVASSFLHANFLCRPCSTTVTYKPQLFEQEACSKCDNCLLCEQLSKGQLWAV